MKYLSLFLFVVKGALFCEELTPFEHSPIWAQNLYFQKYHWKLIDDSVKNIQIILNQYSDEIYPEVKEMLQTEVDMIKMNMGARK